MRRRILSLVAGLAHAAAELHAQGPALEPAPGASVPSLGWTHAVHSLRSEALGESLRIFVSKPPAYARSAGSLPVLYLLDGQYYFAEVAACVAALASTGQIPELVLVGIESHDRRRDFTPAGIVLPDVGAGARAETYLDMLEHELVPAVEASLRGGRPRVLLGHSHAALLATFALATRPTLFPFVLELDGPLHLERGFVAEALVRTLAEPATPPLRLVSIARSFGWPDERWNALAAAARPTDRLLCDRSDDETHESMVFAATYRGLKRLFDDYSALGARELSALEAEQRYQRLTPLYGTEMAPPEPLMRRLVEDLLMEGYGARAGVWLERWTRVYGRPPDQAELARRVKDVEALGEPTETVAELLALPHATPAEMKDHLGLWEGTTGMGARRSPLRVRFWVEDGAVRGEMIYEQGPTMSIEYLRLGPAGTLEFGYRNGMRPRGLLVYTETTPGGPLEGQMLWRGIRFTPPPGEEMPSVHFELARTAEPAR